MYVFSITYFHVHMSATPTEPEEDVGSPRIGVAGCWRGHMELNLGSPDEQYTFLHTEPSLQVIPRYFC